MKRKKLIITAVILAVLVVAGAVTFYVIRKHNQPKRYASVTKAIEATDVDTIIISKTSFTPTNLHVNKGATVYWDNFDTVSHDAVESDSKSGPNSGEIKPGQSYSFTYNNLGTYQYHSTLPPSMTGTITVSNK